MSTATRVNYSRVGVVMLVSLAIASAWLVFPYLIQGRQLLTDVGDSALIMGNTGKVVPPSDPSALARGWQEIIEMDRVTRDRLSCDARKRVKDYFDLPLIVQRYEDVYRASVEECRI